MFSSTLNTLKMAPPRNSPQSLASYYCQLAACIPYMRCHITLQYTTEPVHPTLDGTGWNWIEYFFACFGSSCAPDMAHSSKHYVPLLQHLPEVACSVMLLFQNSYIE